jgi:hypothetical protein
MAVAAASSGLKKEHPPFELTLVVSAGCNDYLPILISLRQLSFEVYVCVRLWWIDWTRDFVAK